MARYCTNCYAPASPEDVFCKVCGQPLKAAVEKTEETTVQMPGDSETVCAEAVIKENNTENAPVISMGEWVWSTLLCFIPIVGLIMLIIWAATSETNPNKKNFARAMLIWKGVEILLSIIFLTMAMAAIIVFGGYGMGYMF